MDHSHEAIDCLTHAVKELTATLKQNFEWFRLHYGPATRDDLKAMEKRLAELIGVSKEDQQKIASILARLEANKDKMEKLLQ